MSIKNNYILFLLVIVLLCCTSAVSAVSNNTIDNVMSEVDSGDEFISVSADDQVDDVDETVLSAQEEYDNLTVNNDDEVLSQDSNYDSLGVTSSETNNYLNDIKASTSDDFYKFVNYLVTKKGFKFNTKTTDEGYSIYSTSKYTSTLFDGENYVLPAKNSYFLSKNRIGYVVMGEYYPDVLYSQNNNIYLDELYLGWLKNVENYHFTLTVGDSNEGIVQVGALSNGVIDTVINGALVNENLINSPEGNSNLPSVFDLRNVSGQNYVTSVKNQAGASTCWIFASIAAMESHLLKTENKTYDFSSNYDFSENNLKNVMSNIGRQGINRTVTSGGFVNFAISYFLRWSGPVLDEFDKYELANNEPINNIPIEFSNVAKHVQGIKYIHARNNESDNDEIKKAIMDYGGVVTSLLWNSQFINGANYYCPDKNLAKPTDGHEICIIGWNDTYSRTNFKNIPEGDGAFIVKNSWGNTYGDDGYYYISYYDATLAMRSEYEINYCVGFSFTLIENNTNYGKNYNYNPLGVTHWQTFNNCDSYYSQWVADNDETLKACGVYVNDACNCSIKIILDDNNIIYNATTTVPLNYAGFHTIVLNNGVSVKKGQKFRIEVTIVSKTLTYVPFEVSWEKIGLYPTYFSSDYYSMEFKGADESGIIVNDKKIRISNCDVCINVYTEFKEILVSKLDVVDALYHDGVFDVKSKVLDSNNNLLKNFELICSPDISGGVKEYQFLKTNDYGEVTLTFSKGIKIINNQLSVSFAFYDALASPIIRKTVNINCPSIIEGNIESISTSNHAKIGSINVKGNVGSISTGTQSSVASINVEGNVGSISTGTQSSIGSIKVNGNSWSISTGTQGKITSIIIGGSIETISTGKQGSVGSIDVKSNVGSISTGTQGKINSINVNGHAGSISTGTQGKINSINVNEYAGSISTGTQGKISSIKVKDKI